MTNTHLSTFKKNSLTTKQLSLEALKSSHKVDASFGKRQWQKDARGTCEMDKHQGVSQLTSWALIPSPPPTHTKITSCKQLVLKKKKRQFSGPLNQFLHHWEDAEGKSAVDRCWAESKLGTDSPVIFNLTGWVETWKDTLAVSLSACCSRWRSISALISKMKQQILAMCFGKNNAVLSY